MDFYRFLTRLAGQALLGIALAVWAAIAVLEEGRENLRLGFAGGAVAALLALIGLRRHWRAASVIGALALIVPIGLLAQSNGGSPWAWLFWLVCVVGTERWLRDASQGTGAVTGKKT